MAQASASRILSLINETPTIRDSDSVSKTRTTARSGSAADGPTIDRIKFQNVSFQYATGSGIKQHQPDPSARSSLAIVGATGGGETTLVNLWRYEPTSGVIRLMVSITGKA